MKKILGFIILILVGTVLVAAGTQRPNKKYRHVRTNKKAWAKIDATSDTLSIDECAPEVWVSCDSILIGTEVSYNDVEVNITDQLHNHAIIEYYSYPLAGLSERILDPADGLVINLVDVL